LADNKLDDIEERRLAVNRRIGMYSIWIVLLGVAGALFFYGGGMKPGQRWSIVGLVVAYVVVRAGLFRKRSKKGS